MTNHFGEGTRTFVLTGGEILDPEGLGTGQRDVFVEEGRVRAVGTGLSVPEGIPRVDVSGAYVSPGFYDMHVHLREPGQEEKETIASGSRAAASGGFTGVASMPNTSPPVDTVGTVELIIRKGREAGHAVVHPIATITQGQKGEALTEMAELAEAGAIAFSDDGFPVTNSFLMRRAMEYAAALGRPIVCHAEDLSLAANGVMNEGALSLRLGLRGIPREAEELGTIRDVTLARLTGCPTHICHVSTVGGVAAIRRARAEGAPVTGEAAPHHFTLTEERVIGYRTDAKMNPPLRTGEDVDAVIEGLRDGTLEVIATDHAPHTAEEKEAEFDRAPFGILGLETALGLAVSQLLVPGHLSAADLVRKLSVAPRRILGVGGGTIAVDETADLTVWNPGTSWVVSREDLFSRSANSPFLGMELTGRASITISAGKVTFWRESLAPRV
jgi:dihydroorotase